MEFLLLLAFVPLLFLDVFDSKSSDDDAEDRGPAVEGTTGSDLLAGTEEPEDILARAGDDLALGEDGDDMISLDEGDDIADGGNGNDLIFGGSGDDLVTGGVGNDTIWLGDGDDGAEFFVSLNPPVEVNVEGDDQISGGDGNDILQDWVGANTLTGGLGNDFVVAPDEMGTDDADSLSGGWAADVLLGDDGDTMSGGESIDFFSIYTDEATDAVVTVTDFDGATELLSLDFDDAEFGNVRVEDLTTTTDPDSGDVSIQLGDQVIAVLLNPAEFDLSKVLV